MEEENNNSSHILPGNKGKGKTKSPNDYKASVITVIPDPDQYHMEKIEPISLMKIDAKI